MRRIVLILLASGYIGGFGIIDLEQRRTKWATEDETESRAKWAW